jgi:hypothetical protein
MGTAIRPPSPRPEGNPALAPPEGANCYDTGDLTLVQVADG